MFEVVAFCFDAGFESSREVIDRGAQGFLRNLHPFRLQLLFLGVEAFVRSGGDRPLQNALDGMAIGFKSSEYASHSSYVMKPRKRPQNHF